MRTTRCTQLVRRDAPYSGACLLLLAPFRGLSCSLTQYSSVDSHDALLAHLAMPALLSIVAEIRTVTTCFEITSGSHRQVRRNLTIATLLHTDALAPPLVLGCETSHQPGCSHVVPSCCALERSNEHHIEHTFL